VAIVVPAEATLSTARIGAVPPARYAHIVQTPECAFWGVRRTDDTRYECRDIWTKSYRDMVQRYVLEAQEEIEDMIGYLLSPDWVTGVPNDGGERLTDQQLYRYPLLAKWGYVIAGGVRATETIQAGAVVDHTSDPAVVGPIATTVTDTGEVHVYHPGTESEITPSSVTISGGNLTVQIPRCRMVKAALADNPSDGLDYDDLTNFESTVDVVRVYNDPSTNAVLVWPHSCSTYPNCSCSEYTRTACIYVRDSRTGRLDVLQATYSGGAWTSSVTGPSNLCGGMPEVVRLYYYAGVQTLTRQQEDAIVRLAHAKMPEEPCGCEVSQRLWERDREVPKALTREQANCPFGRSNGAWAAWRFAQTFRLVRGGTL